jgi:hypothetical protein
MQVNFGRTMRIETLTMVYNEEFLLPFFLKHHAGLVDRFNVIYDTDSTDRTLEILKANEKVNIIPFTFPDGMDDQLKVDRINEAYQGIDADFVINVDVDEFVFINRRQLLWDSPIASRVKLYNVYRHVTESDLDIDKPIAEQRRHGHFDAAFYHKPIIVKPRLSIKWTLGNHHLTGCEIRDFGFVGAHWANADLCFCLERRMKNRKARQSKYNLERGLTWQHHHCTEESIRQECKAHENDPQVF